ncbi:uncharacterized protein LOC130367817 isoform X2 [Hyla sarda]|uniref:uncharacterized protein LOC130367817 isoform X2 n=1 Tax=Hyla sarda TaxID=327740 RepID=UPI0024C4535C|nr:uncharacterized protein LOC130367817 isoform X2 [Hyla sarda]
MGLPVWAPSCEWHYAHQAQSAETGSGCGATGCDVSLVYERMSSPASSKKKKMKTKHRECVSCQQPLPDELSGDLCEICKAHLTPSSSKRKSLCISCLHPLPSGSVSTVCKRCTEPQETSAFLEDARSFFSWFKSEFSSSSGVSLKNKKEERKAEPSASSSSENASAQSDSSDSEDIITEDFFLFKKENAGKLIRAVKHIMESSKQKFREDKESLFYFPKKPSEVLTGHPVLKTIVEKEFKKPDSRLELGSRFRAVYKLDPSESESWENPAKVDRPVARLSRRTLLPSEDSSILKDPMDKKTDILIKRAYCNTAALMKASLASVPVTRAIRVWLSQLGRNIQEGISRIDLLEEIDTLKTAADFACDLPLDVTRICAKNLAVLNSARRAIYLKPWPGDASSKVNFCALPFEAGFLVGSQLESILEAEKGEKALAFPFARQRKQFQPFRFRKTGFKRRPYQERRYNKRFQENRRRQPDQKQPKTEF